MSPTAPLCPKPEDFLLSAYTFNLPESSIAQQPAAERGTSRLLVLDKTTGYIQHSLFSHLADFLPPHALLVANNTRVAPARIVGQRPLTPNGGGGKLEILLLTPPVLLEESAQTEPLRQGLRSTQAEILLKPAKSVRPGETLFFWSKQGIRRRNSLQSRIWAGTGPSFLAFQPFPFRHPFPYWPNSSPALYQTPGWPRQKRLHPLPDHLQQAGQSRFCRRTHSRPAFCRRPEGKPYSPRLWLGRSNPACWIRHLQPRARGRYPPAQYAHGICGNFPLCFCQHHPGQKRRPPYYRHWHNRQPHPGRCCEPPQWAFTARRF